MYFKATKSFFLLSLQTETGHKNFMMNRYTWAVKGFQNQPVFYQFLFYWKEFNQLLYRFSHQVGGINQFFNRFGFGENKQPINIPIKHS